MALLSTTVPRSLRSVCSSGVVDSTWIVSCTAPNCIWMSRRVVVFTCTTTLAASRLAESLFLSDDVVAAGGEREERIRAFRIGLDRDVLAGGRVGQRHLRGGHDGSGGVGHLTGDDSAVLRVQQRARRQQQKHKNNKVAYFHECLLVLVVALCDSDVLG